jgi:CelD/BcsL family acetyltransferase involved in cellulose biosynthesis
MKLHQLDPTNDPRWEQFIERHPRASVFHTAGWLAALRRTYGYEPVVFTTSPPTGDLENGLVFCRVNSWLTGRRLVSLPFSDHCEPLCDSREVLSFLIRYLQSAFGREEWKYLEIRPIDGSFGAAVSEVGFLPGTRYFLHKIDLSPDLDRVFRSLDKDSVRRRIQRAERAGLTEKSGTSNNLLRTFYELLVMTRGRHQLPPAPYSWFQNLVACHGRAAEIRVAYHGRNAIAAIFTLRFRDVLYYKYGCSDARFKGLGPMPWLLWRAIAEAKSDGAVEFDLGRTQERDAGLLAFKNHWAGSPQSLVYWTFPGVASLEDGWKLKMAKRVFSCMPDKLLAVTGRLAYRHVG